MPTHRLPKIETATISSEGKKCFRRFAEKDGKYKLTKKGGYHSERVALDCILRKKIELMRLYAEKIGAKNIVQSNTTKSVYFTINGMEIRVSDHPKPYFDGLNFIVDWNSAGKNFKDILQIFY